MIKYESSSSLQRLGQLLRQWRLEGRDGEIQEVTAARLGVGLTTYRKMEQGDGGVAIRHWIVALEAMGRLEALFAAAEREQELVRLLDTPSSTQEARRHRGRRRKP
ncbi:hypothetical protein [Endothiovibrio diazotrophicus]